MIGKKILNYEIVSLLGEGGMGNVYLAEHTQLGRKVAIKMLHPRFTSNESLRERFKNEASAMAHLQHPNIVTLYDYMESDDGLFLIMEYVEGMELDEHIRKVSGPISAEESERIMEQVLNAFDYAHSKSIIHRDIKPSNILLTTSGNVKVLDFGIAKLLDGDKSLTKTGTQMGTVLYMSPEQVRGLHVDQRSDIYSLGVTLYQMITGQTPYSTDTTEFEVYNQIVADPLPKASTIYPGVSSLFESIIAKATEKETKNRYQSCAEFLKAFSTKIETPKLIKKETVIKATIVDSEVEIVKTNLKPVAPIAQNKKSRKALWLSVALVGIIGGSYLIWDNFGSRTGNEERTTGMAEERDNTVYVLSGVLNFRSDKSVNARILQALHFGETLELLGAAENPIYEDDMKLVWQKALWNGQEGWIARTIDDQSVVGNESVYEDYQSLFSNKYEEKAEYAKVKVWAYNELIAYLKKQGWLGVYTIRNDDIEIRKEGLHSIVRFRNSLDEKDEDAPYDYIVMMESESDKIAMYLRANGENNGYVAGWTTLPNHVEFLIKKRKGNEVAKLQYNGVDLTDLDETMLGTGDEDGVLTGWFSATSNDLDWSAKTLVESSKALDIIDSGTDYFHFVSEDKYNEYTRGYYTKPSVYWKVIRDGNGFIARRYNKNLFGDTFDLEGSSYFKDSKYITEDWDKTKLFLDIEKFRVILYIRDNYGTSITKYGIIDKYLIENYVNDRDVYGNGEYGT